MSEDTFFCIRCTKRKPHSMLACIVAGRRTCKTCSDQKRAALKGVLEMRSALRKADSRSA